MCIRDSAGPVIPANKKELTFEDIPTLKRMDALVIAKPRKAFTDTEKVILDQYITVSYTHLDVYKRQEKNYQPPI